MSDEIILSRYIYRYKYENRRLVKVIYAKDIYDARAKAIEEIGGVENLIGCRRLYNPNYSNLNLD